MDCLTFRLRRRAYAFGIEVVGAVGDLPPLRRVPLAPPAVLGVAERRGDIVTVLDLPGLLDDDLPEGPLCLVTLSEALAHFGFRLPSSLALARGVEPATAESDAGPATGGARRVRAGQVTYDLVDVATLVSSCLSES